MDIVQTLSSCLDVATIACVYQMEFCRETFVTEVALCCTENKSHEVKLNQLTVAFFEHHQTSLTHVT